MKLKEKVKKAIEDHGIDDKLIQSFLYLISENTLGEKSLRDAKNQAIRALFREGFEIHNPSGTKKIGSKVIQQVLWRVMSKIKFLNYRIHLTGESESVERVVTEGLGTVGDRGGLTSCFRDKGGVFQSAFLNGDGFIMYGKGENSENPISFKVVRGEDVYAEHYAWGIRGVRPTNRLAVVLEFDLDTAYEKWPVLEEEEAFGRIPGTFNGEESDNEIKDNEICEVAWGWNLAKKTQVVFGGAQAVEIERFEGDEYPHWKNNKPFIPVFQFLCQPSVEEFYNYGIGDMVFDLAVISAKLLNMEVGHIEENVYPVTLINAPQNKVDQLVKKMAMAHEARAMGGKPFVAMEFGSGGGQQVSSQTLLTQNLFNEWQAVWDRLAKEISRLGINIDDADRGSGYTRGQVIAEEESSNAFIKQMQEYNATETQEFIECILSGIVEYVNPKNKTLLNLKTRIQLPDGSSKRLDLPVTMGQLAKTLKDGNPFVETDSRTGAITSDLMRSIRLESQLSVTAPNSPEYTEMTRELAGIRGIDFEPSQPSANPNTATPKPSGEEIPSETQRSLPSRETNTLSIPV